MAIVVKEMPREIRRWSYDWDNWFDGRIWKLTESVDYGCFDNLRAAAYYMARGRGKAVSIVKDQGGSVAYLQSV